MASLKQQAKKARAKMDRLIATPGKDKLKIVTAEQWHHREPSASTGKMKARGRDGLTYRDLMLASSRR